MDQNEVNGLLQRPTPNDALTLLAYRIIERWLEWARMHGHLEHAEGIVRDSRVLIANAQISGGTPSAESDCSACFGRGFTYGPTNAYPITEAQEEPERIDCQKCHGTGKKPNAKADTSARSDDSSPAPCSASVCWHEYEADGGPCIHCGQQGGFLTPNASGQLRLADTTKENDHV